MNILSRSDSQDFCCLDFCSDEVVPDEGVLLNEEEEDENSDEIKAPIPFAIVLSNIQATTRHRAECPGGRLVCCRRCRSGGVRGGFPHSHCHFRK